MAWILQHLLLRVVSGEYCTGSKLPQKAAIRLTESA